MKLIEFPPHPRLYKPARISVVASHEVAQKLCCALSATPHTEVNSLDWQISSLKAAEQISENPPDLILCEITDSLQAATYHQELGFLWPEATLVSCEPVRIADQGEGLIGLEEVSQQAGYQGHLIIDEVALQLPIFLRYAEQRYFAGQQAKQLLQLKKLLDAANRMHSSLDQQQVSGEILQEFGQWVKADNWQLYAVSDDKKFIELVGSEGVRIKPPLLTLKTNGTGLIERVLQQGEMIALSRAELEQLWASKKEMLEGGFWDRAATSILCFPLTVGKDVVGVGQATRIEKEECFGIREQEILQQISSIAALALNNATQFARAERLYMQDDLTQLHNSRFLRQFLENEYKRVRRYGGQVAVIFIDLDGFKGVNDRFGHRVGSETLKETATLLLDSVRDTDVVTRYGGDEFTIVLPNTNAEKAFITAERIRQKVADHEYHGGSRHTFRLTASFGIAGYPEFPAQSAADLLEQSDMAMYEAKAANKNNVKLAKP